MLFVLFDVIVILFAWVLFFRLNFWALHVLKPILIFAPCSSEARGKLITTYSWLQI